MANDSSEISADQLQFQLFQGWLAGSSEQEYSRTLEFWDVIPWRLLSHARGGKLPEVIIFESVKLDEHREVTVFLTPAILRPRSRKNGDDPKVAASTILFPGVREELVERALRKLAVQQAIQSRVKPNPTDGGLAIEIIFTLHRLRTELESTGHGLTIAQIREALHVMHVCNVAVECPRDAFVHGKSGPILPTLEFVRDPNDREGNRSLYRATFHPLASAAILAQLFHPINYARVMSLTPPLARYVFATPRAA